VTETKARSDQANDLRKRAEEKARADGDKPVDILPPEETRQVLHELRVHQIELEMQNEELRRAQAEIEASRARYFDLYDLAPVGYITLSKKGLILEANLTAATLFSVARGDLVKHPLPRFILAEDQDIYYRHRKQLFETGAPQVCELRMLRADAAPFWARLEATAAQDADGATVCRAVVNDITERKRAEEALQASQQAKYEQVVSMISDVVWRYEVDDRGQFVNNYISPVADRLLGLQAGTIGSSFDKYLSYVYPEELPPLQKMLFSGLHGLAKDATTEYRMRKPDGTTRWVRSKGSAYPQPNGHIVGVGTTTDITDRKRVEEALRETNEHLDNLFNYANAPIIVWDPQFRITRFNHAFESLTGRRADEVVGKSLEVLFPPTLVESSMERIAETLWGERWEAVEIGIRHVDGFVRTVLWNSAPIFGPDGKTPMATIAQGQDITERKRAEEALREEKDYTQNIIHSMADMLVVVAPDGRIATVNQATCDLLGYPEHELIGQPATLLFKEEEEEEEEEEEDTTFILSQHPLPVKRTVLRCCAQVEMSPLSHR
jgi:PAS domain S-box-containing protein